MYPQYQTRRRRINWVIWFVPVTLICCLAVVLLAPALPGVVLQLVGFTPKGSVDEFWQDLELQVTPVNIVGNLPPVPPQGAGSGLPGTGATPTPVIISGLDGASVAEDVSSTPPDYNGWFQTASIPQVLVVSSSTGSVTVNTSEAYVSDARFGMGVDGFPLGVIEYQENALPGICATWLRGCVTDQFAVTVVDFRPGGLLVNGTVNVGGVTQSLGLALGLGADGKSMVPQGIVLGGQLYAIPQSGDIADYVAEAVSRSNEALGQLQVQADGRSLGLVQMQIMDDRLTLIFR